MDEIRKNIKLVIAYDGANYLGWQKTSAGPTIEQTLESILEKILQEPISLQAASRTDAGVHAHGQVVNFFTSRTIDPNRFRISLNQLLPSDIALILVEKVEYDFHPTVDSTGKEYRYSICNNFFQLPEHRFSSWHYPYSLDFNEMRKAALHFIGTHDFVTFCNMKNLQNYENTIRQIDAIEIIELDEKRIQFKIRGNHFLYKMVRNIVGTLLHVGRKKIKAEDIPRLLQGQDRTQAGITAPAHGLTLYRVNYKGNP